jgi:S1-C subfamily serine protease
LWALAGALVVGTVVTFHAMLEPKPRTLAQKDIDAAVLHTLDTTVLPSSAARAYEAIRPSVVHVRSLRRVLATDDIAPGVRPHVTPRHPPPTVGRRASAPGPDGTPPDTPSASDRTIPEGYTQGIGTGVVIVDNGTILTNLHVVAGAQSIMVTFFDGFESVADVVSTQPENDLAVLKSRQIPDDLQPATLRSTADLNVGDEVVAVGFPFGIGPSASYGVVSGLRREYRSPEGSQTLTNLIQFDAAANPGNSGGPLVTADGAVVGIVTGIYNPTEERVFIGIGFAIPIENAASAVGLSPF